VDTDIFYPADKSKEEIKKNLLISNKQLSLTKKWIIFAGRLQEVKAPLRLIETFFEYHKTDKDSSLLIAGEGNLRKKTENYTRELGIKNSVYFLGIKNQLELAEYYKAADVMLLVSNFEGMPMSVLEALGCGIPVVSTDVGEVSRVVKNGFSGEVVDNFSPVTISSAIRKVLQNLGQYSKENCVSSIFEYSPQKVLESLYCLIRDLS
jgi:glycosyltransferase involved in cell wall biosynthesis